MGCMVELVRTDQLREYVLDCTKDDTFEDAAKKVAELEKVSF